MSADTGPPPSEAIAAVAVRQLHAPSARNFTPGCLILRMRTINNVTRVLHYGSNGSRSSSSSEATFMVLAAPKGKIYACAQIKKARARSIDWAEFHTHALNIHNNSSVPPLPQLGY